MEEAATRFAAFKREFDAPSPDLQKCSEMLTGLKVSEVELY
jgi:hypothetical protein